MKILVTGATGLLGNAYLDAATRRSHELIALSHSQVVQHPAVVRNEQIDGTDLDSLTALCLEIWPDVIVNCAAISNPASVDANPQLAEKINVALPRHLAQISTHLGARLLHISTDMVFDGHSAEAYRSTDMPCPTSLYGQTKLMAEREVLEHNSEDPVVLRIPILMGNSPSGARSLHEKLFAAIRKGERPKLFCDEIRQPCSAGNVADVLVELSERRDLHGIFHWAGNEALSRFEIGQRILKHFDLPLDMVESVVKGDNPDFANRPSNLTFNLDPIVGKLKTRPIDFEAQLEELTFIEPMRA
ncbi:SDR family oxidoreductase [Coraliomargarita akajimensis]|uniref:dTDP-4-dehydrorhamnose reductase n=1 Tax=Coraliomargarita akajimensis (strain DSM 45221 / IAM 15411 / JCM 23193 / KCTC 12865 / 04OKA010-24) TaxID=583355 RepID=D5ENH1_CORAD|nr:SDR family oxidoreductase [Coraliomargarita akajimensis]ADE55447.1 dTDP-4-dehydrorhamnose reductase [Coraliomargarita akajimensis DSM 45221]